MLIVYLFITVLSLAYTVTADSNSAPARDESWESSTSTWDDDDQRIIDRIERGERNDGDSGSHRHWKKTHWRDRNWKHRHRNEWESGRDRDWRDRDWKTRNKHDWNTGCRIPNNTANCGGLIFDCADQLLEAETSRWNSLACLDINTMERPQFDLAVKSCDVVTICNCTVAYYHYCDYDPDEYNFKRPWDAPSDVFCLSGDTVVDTDNGTMTMRDLRNSRDALVKVIDPDNQITYSPILFWLHAEEGLYPFYDVVAGKRRLSLSAQHVIYTVPCEGGDRVGKYASELEVGDCVLSEQDGRMVPIPVTALERSRRTGIYTPLTTTGTIVVNGIGASNYANTKHERLAHFVHTKFHYLDTMFGLSNGQQWFTPSALSAMSSLSHDVL